MIGGMDAFDQALPAALVAAIAAAVAAAIGPEATRYRVTAVRPVGWSGAAWDGAGMWGFVGRQETALARHHFGEGRRA